MQSSMTTQSVDRISCSRRKASRYSTMFTHEQWRISWISRLMSSAVLVCSGSTCNHTWPCGREQHLQPHVTTCNRARPQRQTHTPHLLSVRYPLSVLHPLTLTATSCPPHVPR